MAGFATQAPQTYAVPLADLPVTPRVAVTGIATETHTKRARMPLVTVSSTGPRGGSTTSLIRRIASSEIVNVYRSKHVRGTEAVACLSTSRTARSKWAVSLATGACKGVSADDGIGVRHATDAVSMPRVEPAELVGGALPQTAHSLVRRCGSSIRQPTAMAGSHRRASVFAPQRPKRPAASGPLPGLLIAAQAIIKMESQP
jgi:hypothetical protein